KWRTTIRNASYTGVGIAVILTLESWTERKCMRQHRTKSSSYWNQEKQCYAKGGCGNSSPPYRRWRGIAVTLVKTAPDHGKGKFLILILTKMERKNLSDGRRLEY